MAEPARNITSDNRDPGYWLQLWEMLQNDRANFDSHWGEVARKIRPEADQFRTQRTPGEKRRQLVFSSHAGRALKKWVRIVLSLAAPKTSQWQQILPEDAELEKDPAAKVFFEEVTRRAFKMRLSPRARFYESLTPCLLDYGAFGNGCFFIDETPLGAAYTPIALSQVWIALDHMRRVQTVFYRYTMSAAAADMKWHKLWGASPPKRIKDALEKAPYANDIVFLHVVTPRRNVNPDELGPGAMAWRSLHIEVEDRILVDEGGYHEMPYMFPRDMVEAGEIYARGAGMEILPEMGTLDAQKRTFLQAGERVAAPPILMRDDATTLGARKINLTPWGLNGGMLDSRGNPLLRPFESGARLDLSREMMQDEMEAMNDAFSLNLFRLLIEDPRSNVTAFEIAQRMEEKGQLIGPAIDSIQSEIFGLETERLIGIMARRGDLPEVPPVVAEAGTYRIQHTSPANQLQRAGEIAAITGAIQVIEPLAAIDPMVLKKFRAGRIIDRVMEIRGGPTDCLLTEEEFDQLMADAAQQQQAAAQGAQLEQGAGAGKDIAQALTLLQGGQSAPAA